MRLGLWALRVIAYAARTGTLRNLAALREAGWRLMVSARGRLKTEGFPYALDNGAWTAFREWGEGKRATPQPCLRSFVQAVDKLGAGADFIIVPDIVAGGLASWAMTRAWLRRLRRRPDLRGATFLLPVQNGMGPELVDRFLGPRVGIFVGGDTAWKEATLGQWGALARRRGAICHAGRVNTRRRIVLCELAGIHSFDGSSASRFVDTLPLLDDARHRRTLLGEISRRLPSPSPSTLSDGREEPNR